MNTAKLTADDARKAEVLEIVCGKRHKASFVFLADDFGVGKHSVDGKTKFFGVYLKSSPEPEWFRCATSWSTQEEACLDALGHKRGVLDGRDFTVQARKLLGYRAWAPRRHEAPKSRVGETVVIRRHDGLGHKSNDEKYIGPYIGRSCKIQEELGRGFYVTGIFVGKPEKPNDYVNADGYLIISHENIR